MPHKQKSTPARRRPGETAPAAQEQQQVAARKQIEASVDELRDAVCAMHRRVSVGIDEIGALIASIDQVLECGDSLYHLPILLNMLADSAEQMQADVWEDADEVGAAYEWSRDDGVKRHFRTVGRWRLRDAAGRRCPTPEPPQCRR